VYDSAGERVRKVVEKGNIKEERYYFGDYEIYRKFVSGVLETERTTANISDDKAKIATVDTLTVDQGSLTVNPVAVIRYQLDNHLGSASLELDETADIITYEEYHPFGTTSYRSGRTETETSQKRYKYVGKERDEETGLYYYGFRYYAAWLCRFVSVDPMKGERVWLSPYNYCQNNPINKVDPTGALDEDPPNSAEMFEINTDNGEVTSVSIAKITNIIFGENGEIISGIGKAENHQHLSILKESDLYKSLSEKTKKILNKELRDLNPSVSQQSNSYKEENSYEFLEDGEYDYLAGSNTALGIFAGLKESSSLANNGRYINSLGKNVPIEGLKNLRNFKKDGLGFVKNFGNAEKISKNAKKAIAKTKFFKGLGTAAAIGGVAYTWYTVDKSDPDAVVKASVDTAFAVIGLLGPIGFGISTAYFIADWAVTEFYPGSWKGLGKDISNNIMTIHNLHTRDGVMMNPSVLGK